MQSITFHCELITPLFMSGADGTTPELRAPSIKGALRFWWRAMNGHLSLDDMRKEEGEIFGITSQRSKVMIRANMIEKREGQLGKSDSLLGRDYLMYSVFPPMNDKKAFLTGTFEVHLSGTDINLLKEAAYCFWLLSILGGLGTRSRRGSGNFVITKIEGIDFGFSFNASTNNLVEFSEYLRTNFKIIKNHFNVVPNATITDFPCFKNCAIFLLNRGRNNSEDALNDIGTQYMTFRRRRMPDYKSVKDYIQFGTQPATIEKSVFGLPIGYRYRSLQGKGATIEGRSTSRSASSLFIEVVKVGNQFYPLILNFNSKLLETSDRLKISSKEQRGNTKNPNQPQPISNLKTLFINGLTNKEQIL